MAIDRVSISNNGVKSELRRYDNIVFLGDYEDVAKLNKEADSYIPQFGGEYEVVGISVHVRVAVRTDDGQDYWLPAKKCVVGKRTQIKGLLK